MAKNTSKNNEKPLDEAIKDYEQIRSEQYAAFAKKIREFVHI